MGLYINILPYQDLYQVYQAAKRFGYSHYEWDGYVFEVNDFISFEESFTGMTVAEFCK